MIHITCDAEKLEELRYEHFHHPHPRVQMKMAAVHMTVVGIGRDQVAAVLGCTTETVTTYLKPYQQGGVDALRRLKWGVSGASSMPTTTRCGPSSSNDRPAA